MRSVFILVGLLIAGLPPVQKAPFGLNRDLIGHRHVGRIVLLPLASADAPSDEAVAGLREIASRSTRQEVVIETAARLKIRKDGTPKCRRARFRSEDAYVVIRGVDSPRKAYAWSQVGADTCGARSLYVITVNRRSVAPLQELFQPVEIDERALVHEYGHLLRLARNPSHGTHDRGWHCTNSVCPLSIPNAAAGAVGIMNGTLSSIRDFCEDCRRDLEVALRLWSE